MISKEILQFAQNRDASRLVLKATEQLTTVDFSKLQNSGIWRERSSYFLNIAYPSLQVMGLISPSQVYPSSPREKGRRVALYVHIPFCTAECYYCHYYKKFAQSHAQVDDYLKAIEKELALYKIILGDLNVESIYIGGGTPSYLTPEQIKYLFNTIYAHTFVSSTAEVSFELHPESTTPARLDMLVHKGVNRFNIGIESFEDSLLKNENRRHTALQAIEAYQAALRTGVNNINLDLIYGLKDQQLEGWEYNLDQVGILKPTSVTTYYLRLKRGTPEYKLWKLRKDTFPSDAELLLMHAMTFERMEHELGYSQLPVDWYIRQEQFFHQYQDYNWRRSDEVELLGLGASAYSYVNGWQYYNVNDNYRYQQALDRGELPIWKGERLEGDEPMRRTVMLGLKIGIIRRSFEQLYGIDVVDAFAPTWERLVALDLIAISPEAVQLTYVGKLFADEVGQQFYSDQVKQRMSVIDPELVSTTWPQFNP